MFFEQVFFEAGSHVSAQGLVVKQELLAGGDPLAAVPAEAAAGDEIMNVGMEDEGARPGVEHAQYSELRAESLGMGGQILQGFGGERKEEVQRQLLMRTEKPPQWFRNGEGHQEVRCGQEQPGALALEPGVGIGLTALGTVTVIAGMIAVFKG